MSAGRVAGRSAAGAWPSRRCLLFGLGSAWWAANVGATHAYATDLLPGMLVTGAGVGLVLATLSEAAVSSLPPGRLATGGAVITMSRQIGSVLGVAILVAIVGEPARAEAVDAFSDGWWFMSSTAGAAALAALAMRPAATAVEPVAPVPAVATGAEA